MSKDTKSNNAKWTKAELPPEKLVELKNDLKNLEGMIKGHLNEITKVFEKITKDIDKDKK